MMEYWGERANLRCPSGRFRIGPAMIIKTPAANGFADRQHLWGSLWVG
jgi:hypothetical protein